MSLRHHKKAIAIHSPLTQSLTFLIVYLILFDGYNLKKVLHCPPKIPIYQPANHKHKNNIK